MGIYLAKSAIQAQFLDHPESSTHSTGVIYDRFFIC